MAPHAALQKLFRAVAGLAARVEGRLRVVSILDHVIRGVHDAPKHSPNWTSFTDHHGRTVLCIVARDHHRADVPTLEVLHRCVGIPLQLVAEKNETQNLEPRLRLVAALGENGCIGFVAHQLVCHREDVASILSRFPCPRQQTLELVAFALSAHSSDGLGGTLDEGERRGLAKTVGGVADHHTHGHAGMVEFVSFHHLHCMHSAGGVARILGRSGKPYTATAACLQAWSARGRQPFPGETPRADPSRAGRRGRAAARPGLAPLARRPDGNSLRVDAEDAHLAEAPGAHRLPHLQGHGKQGRKDLRHGEHAVRRPHDPVRGRPLGDLDRHGSNEEEDGIDAEDHKDDQKLLVVLEPHLRRVQNHANQLSLARGYVGLGADGDRILTRLQDGRSCKQRLLGVHVGVVDRGVVPVERSSRLRHRHGFPREARLVGDRRASDEHHVARCRPGAFHLDHVAGDDGLRREPVVRAIPPNAGLAVELGERLDRALVACLDVHRHRGGEEDDGELQRTGEQVGIPEPPGVEHHLIEEQRRHELVVNQLPEAVHLEGDAVLPDLLHPELRLVRRQAPHSNLRRGLPLRTRGCDGIKGGRQLPELQLDVPQRLGPELDGGFRQDLDGLAESLRVRLEVLRKATRDHDAHRRGGRQVLWVRVRLPHSDVLRLPHAARLAEPVAELVRVDEKPRKPDDSEDPHREEDVRVGLELAGDRIVSVEALLIDSSHLAVIVRVDQNRQEDHENPHGGQLHVQQSQRARQVASVRAIAHVLFPPRPLRTFLGLFPQLRDLIGHGGAAELQTLVLHRPRTGDALHRQNVVILQAEMAICPEHNDAKTQPHEHEHDSSVGKAIQRRSARAGPALTGGAARIWSVGVVIGRQSLAKTAQRCTACDHRGRTPDPGQSPYHGC
eukprot:scaffold48_cov311-Pinguiococcus_pyrenoidosus.AAC.197